jgi:hypothetical protein
LNIARDTAVGTYGIRQNPEIPLRSLLQSPTLAEVAAMIIKHQTKKLSEADLNRLLARLESLSDEYAARLLKGESE